MSDVATDYGEHTHPIAEQGGESSWVDALQDVLDEVVLDLTAASPTGKPYDGTMIAENIDGNVRPLVACTWLELTQVGSHWWLPSGSVPGVAHIHSWPDLLRSAEGCSRHTDKPQVLHYHLQGAKCNRGCRLVRPA